MNEFAKGFKIVREHIDDVLPTKEEWMKMEWKVDNKEIQENCQIETREVDSIDFG